MENITAAGTLRQKRQRFTNRFEATDLGGSTPAATKEEEEKDEDSRLTASAPPTDLGVTQQERPPEKHVALPVRRVGQRRRRVLRPEEHGDGRVGRLGGRLVVAIEEVERGRVCHLGVSKKE